MITTLVQIVGVVGFVLGVLISFLLGRGSRQEKRDVRSANEVRRRAQVAQEKFRDEVVDIDDDTLDRRLRQLRDQK
jgi:uncharacterized membrane protein